MYFTDTHCHIHSRDYPLDPPEVMARATAAGVNRLICVGTDEDDSALAVDFARNQPNLWASIAVHPHEAVHGAAAIRKLRALLASGRANKIIAIGECGLDYFYEHSPRDQQIRMLRAQIELALEYNRPLIFHVREAFADFWPIFDSYSGLRGVVHSFTDSKINLDSIIERDLFVGVNGICTFSKSRAQTEMYAQIPLSKLLLETDSPYLTPVPKRGTVNEPAFVTLVARYLADLHRVSLEEIARTTSQNATQLFFKNQQPNVKSTN